MHNGKPHCRGKGGLGKTGERRPRPGLSAAGPDASREHANSGAGKLARPRLGEQPRPALTLTRGFRDGPLPFGHAPCTMRLAATAGTVGTGEAALPRLKM